MRQYRSIGVERSIVMGFLSLILAGAFVLWWIQQIAGKTISFVDCLFTATSAVCVTGLTVVDTGKGFTLASQFVIMILIQLGGLGIMTVATAMRLAARQRINLQQRFYFAGGLGTDTPQGAVRLLKRVIRVTFAIEAAGAAFLFVGFIRHGESWLRAAYLAVFHSVSAFCNAGFSPYTDNLEGFATSWIVPGIVMALIVVGGIGYPVLDEVIDRYCRKCEKKKTFSVSTRLVLRSTALLIAIGAGLLLFSEWNGAFKEMPLVYKAWNALFASITPRTAGFDTVHYAHFTGPGLAITVILMVIGASPSSTGGGIKTTTIGVLVVTVLDYLKERNEVRLWERSVELKTIQRAIALFFVYITTLCVAAVLLNFIEEKTPFYNVFFEVASALGTVGLSRGATPTFSDPGKIVLTCLMFWGRVGLITFFYTLVSQERKVHIHYPETNIPIG